jgi:hypothetical protein
VKNVDYALQGRLWWAIVFANLNVFDPTLFIGPPAELGLTECSFVVGVNFRMNVESRKSKAVFELLRSVEQVEYIAVYSIGRSIVYKRL